MDPGFASFAAGSVELIGADVDEPGRVAVVGRLEDDGVLTAGVRPGQAEGQLVGLAGRVEDVADAERRRHEGREPFRVADEVVVEIAGVRVQEGHLVLNRADDAGMAVADEGDVVVGVEIGPPGLVVEILHPAADDLQGFAVGDAEIAAEEPPARGQGLRFFRFPGGKAVGGDAQDQVGVRGEAGPERAPGGGGDAGEVPVETEKVQDDLDVDVRPPIAVRGRGADGREGLAGPEGRSGHEAGDRIPVEMSVEREEFLSGGDGVAEDDQRPVVLGRGVVGDGVDGSVERGAHGASRRRRSGRCRDGRSSSERSGFLRRRRRRWYISPGARRSVRRPRPRRLPSSPSRRFP